MKANSGDELLAAANPIPNVNKLEAEAFSIADVMDRLDGPLAPGSGDRATGHRRSRSMAVAGAAFALVLAIGAAGTLILRGDGSAVSNGLVCDAGGSETMDRDDFFGSGSYNPFVGIQQSLVSRSDEPMFSAQVVGDVPAANLYFRLITMETYNGSLFYASRPSTSRLDSRPWVDPCQQWSGSTTPVTADIEIERLRVGWLPAPGTPAALRSAEELIETVGVRYQDGSLALDGESTYPGMRYTVDTELPRLELGALIADADGRLTPVFAAAAASGESLPNAQPAQTLRATPSDPKRHTSLPSDDGLRTEELRTLAEGVTAGAESAFERGLYLEAWFHSDAFSYSLDVEPGDATDDLPTWLLDAESAIYHVGSAEQFATALAVLARTMDIPSRVALGFAPGDSTDGKTVVLYDRDAHAWVELWIPQHGWMRFDPTPRPSGDTTPTYESISEQLGFDLTRYLVR